MEGNIRADELAEEAREMSDNDHVKNQTEYVRFQIQKGVSSLLRGISVCSLQMTKLTLGLMARLRKGMTSIPKLMPLRSSLVPATPS